jgi:hypothetical protein
MVKHAVMLVVYLLMQGLCLLTVAQTTIPDQSVDIRKIFVAASAVPIKESFETTEQYQQRVSTHWSKPANLRLSGDSVAIAITAHSALDRNQDDKFGWSYDADTRWLRIKFPSEYLYKNESSFVPLEVDTDTKMLGNFVGKNAYGTKAKVQRQQTQSMRLALPNEWRGKELRAQVSPEVAKNLMLSQLVLIGSLMAPYYHDGTTIESATIRYPVETEEWRRYVFFSPTVVAMRPSFGDRTPVIFSIN